MKLSRVLVTLIIFCLIAESSPAVLATYDSFYPGRNAVAGSMRLDPEALSGAVEFMHSAYQASAFRWRQLAAAMFFLHSTAVLGWTSTAHVLGSSTSSNGASTSWLLGISAVISGGAVLTSYWQPRLTHAPQLSEKNVERLKNIFADKGRSPGDCIQLLQAMDGMDFLLADLDQNTVRQIQKVRPELMAAPATLEGLESWILRLPIPTQIAFLDKLATDSMHATDPLTRQAAIHDLAEADAVHIAGFLMSSSPLLDSPVRQWNGLKKVGAQITYRLAPQEGVAQPLHDLFDLCKLPGVSENHLRALAKYLYSKPRTANPRYLIAMQRHTVPAARFLDTLNQLHEWRNGRVSDDASQKEDERLVTQLETILEKDVAPAEHPYLSDFFNLVFEFLNVRLQDRTNAIQPDEAKNIAKSLLKEAKILAALKDPVEIFVNGHRDGLLAPWVAAYVYAHGEWLGDPMRVFTDTDAKLLRIALFELLENFITKIASRWINAGVPYWRHSSLNRKENVRKLGMRQLFAQQGSDDLKAFRRGGLVLMQRSS